MLKAYVVHVIPRRIGHTSAGADCGHDVEVRASNKREAVSMARKIVARDFIYDRHDGPLVYVAREG